MYGVVPVIPTPFSRDGTKILYDEFATVIESALREGAETVALFGAGGEFYKLSDAEMRELLNVAVQVCRGKGNVMATVTKHGTLQAKEQAVQYQEMGAAAINIMPPSFGMPTSDMVLEHILDLSSVIKVPVMIQYAPALTGGTIRTEIFAQIAEQINNELYVKLEALPTGPLITAFAKATGGKLRMAVGNGGECLYEAWERGASVVIPGSAFVKPYADIIRAFTDNSHKEALRLYRQFLPYLHFVHRHIEEFVCMEKIVLHKRGLVSNFVRRKPSMLPDQFSHQLLLEIADHVVGVFYG